MSWLADPVYRVLLVQAFLTTCLIAGATILLSNLLAVPLAIWLTRTRGAARRLLVGYSFLARAVPVLAILFGLYYGLPAFGIYLEPVPSALVGLVFASTAYNMEFLRGGLEAVPRGQADAARALGMPTWLVYRKVILPQALVAAAPALFSNAVQIVKGSSLASLVAVTELSGASATIIAETYEAMSVLAVIAALYLAIAGVVLAAQWLYERRRHAG